VEIIATWSQRQVVIEIADDGPGIPADVMDALGEPYITTRPARTRSQIKDGGPSGLGLGFFIAKTLLERSGATVTLDNRERPRHGAIVKISWPREVFERKEATALALPARRAEPQRVDADGGVH
jgi:two-component system sensor histidine kinase RegB